MTIPVDNSDRQAEAYAFLRGALSRCDQEGCAFLDVIRVVKSWADAKNIAKKPTFTFEKATSENVNVGDIVRIENNAYPGHEIGKIGKVTEKDSDNDDGSVYFLVSCNNEEWWYNHYNLSVRVPEKPSQPQQPEWVSILPDRSNRPAVGDLVKLTDYASPYTGMTGKVTDIDEDSLGTFIEINDTSDAWYYDREILVQSKPLPKTKTTHYIRLTDKSPMPEIGAKVRIEDNAFICAEGIKAGDIFTVKAHDKYGEGVYVLEEDYGYFEKKELSLVIEE